MAHDRVDRSRVFLGGVGHRCHGNHTLAGYNTRDQLVWSEDELGNPGDYVYDAANDVLTTATGPDPDGAGSLGRPTTGYRYDETKIGTTSTPGAALEGLRADYYDNINLAGRPKVRQTDASVDFSWGTSGPGALGTTVDNFSVRWSGNLSVPSTGAYTFSTVSDEGTRLTVDGTVAIDNWADQTVTTKTSQAISLAAGLHRISLDYYEHTGSAEVHLKWSCAACSPAISTQVIPSSALRPAWLNTTSTVSPLGNVVFNHVAAPDTGLADYTQAKLASGTSVITSYRYDSYGRITQKVMPKGNASATIDSDGNLQGTPDAKYITSWAYYGLTETAAPPTACGGGSAVNQAGQLKTKSVYGLTTQTFVYNTAGDQVARTNAAGSQCFAHDAEGQLTSEKAPGDTQATTFTYDPAGNTRTVTDASGTITTSYDETDRVTRAIDSYGAEATFAYDAEGNLTQRVAAKGALNANTNYTTSYTYNAANDLTGVTDPASRAYAFGYDIRGALRWTQYPNATYSWNDYNADGALAALYNRHGTLAGTETSVPSDASPIADYANTYTLEGQKSQEVRTGGSLTSETTTYGYDNLGRLAQTTLPSGTARTYSFDLDSNRTAIVENGSTVASYTYDPTTTAGIDQLTNVTQGTTRTMTYTGDGQTSGRGSDTLSWNGWGAMTGGTFGGSTIAYSFDPLGRIRQRVEGSTTTRYLFAGGSTPLFETNARSPKRTPTGPAPTSHTTPDHQPREQRSATATTTATAT